MWILLPKQPNSPGPSTVQIGGNDALSWLLVEACLKQSCDLETGVLPWAPWPVYRHLSTGRLLIDAADLCRHSIAVGTPRPGPSVRLVWFVITGSDDHQDFHEDLDDIMIN